MIQLVVLVEEEEEERKQTANSIPIYFPSLAIYLLDLFFQKLDGLRILRTTIKI